MKNIEAPQDGQAQESGHQKSEDLEIRKILDPIPDKNKWCVEFGAWDGDFLCNTRFLIRDHGYSAVLIEGSRKKFAQLQKNYLGNKNVFTFNKLVGFNNHDNLDTILSATPIPADFDFLTIDIDGNDYHVWNACVKYKPKVVLVEFNPTIPTEVRFVQPADPALAQGTSLLSFVDLGKQKGYELVSVTQWNAFFVRSEYFPLYNIADNRPEVLRKYLALLTYIFSGYDGTVFLRGNCGLPWHNIYLKESKVQHVPKFFRHYPGRFSLPQRFFFFLFTDPVFLIKKIFRLS
jgi:hypothetical protein